MAMADVAARKRARSPSPGYGDTLASPLEVLLKRRRRGDFNIGRMPPPPVWGAPSIGSASGSGSGSYAASGPSHGNTPIGMGMGMDEEDHSASSSHEQSSPLRDGYFGGVERRRQRQWERLQAPSLSQPPPQLPNSSPMGYRQMPASQPLHPPLQRSTTNESMASASSEYELDVRRTTGAHLSSSPIRHQPPGSTPFRPNHEWTPEDRLREWGDEYASQNSLLHSLHLARYESQHQAIPSPTGTPYSSRTVDMSHTPYQGNTHLTPAQPHLPTPYRYARGTPQETPGLGVSSPWASSPALNSPFPDFPSAPTASPINFGREQEAIQASYEEANRLLAELNMQRLRRHGGAGQE